MSVRETLRPLRDLVVVEEYPPAEKIGSVLVIREDQREKLCRGRVLAVGPKNRDVQVGDVVLWPRRFGRPASAGKEDNRVVLEASWIEGVEE